MAYTLIGFVGPILGSPENFGIPKAERKMAGFLHMWRVLGFLHGLKDEFNPFEINDPIKTRLTVFSVFEECLIPKLYDPPEMFQHMSGVIW